MNPIKPTIKSEIIPIIVVLMTVIASFYFYKIMPDQVPVHWNMEGIVDRYGSKTEAALLFPVIIVGMYIMFMFLPIIDPKKDRYQQFNKVYHIFKAVLVSYMALIYIIASLNGIGYNIPINIWMPILVGSLFVIIGNYLSKIKPNWFMGIRTPWTLSSEEVWNKTHRVGGKLFISGGAIIMFVNVFPYWVRIPLMMSVIILMSVGTIYYSYYVYKNEKNKINK